jgi:hypothetical protein
MFDQINAYTHLSIYFYSINSYHFNPSSLVKGEDFQIDVTGSLSEPIDVGAYVNLKLKYGSFTVLKATLDLCDKITAIDKQCPLKEGPFQVNEVVQIPTTMRKF